MKYKMSLIYAIRLNIDSEYIFFVKDKLLMFVKDITYAIAGYFKT